MVFHGWAMSSFVRKYESAESSTFFLINPFSSLAHWPVSSDACIRCYNSMSMSSGSFASKFRDLKSHANKRAYFWLDETGLLSSLSLYGSFFFKTQ